MQPRHVFLFVAASILSAALLPARGSAGAYQHVRNGDFEQGAVGWTLTLGTTLDVFESDVAPPLEGARSARVRTSDRRFVLRQSIEAPLGAGEYKLALLLNTRVAIRLTATLVGVNDGADRAESSIEVAAGAHELEFTLRASSPDRRQLLISGLLADDAEIYIDDVRLEGAPPVELTPTPTRTATPVVSAGAPVTPTPGGRPTTVAASPTAARLEDVIAATVRNAGFEDVDEYGSPWAWEKFGGVLSTSPYARGGERAARLESTTDSTKWLYQSVYIDPGGTYTFGAWLAIDGGNVRSAFLRVSWYASTDGSGPQIDSVDSMESLPGPSGGYRHLTTGPITAPADARSARLRVLLAPDGAAPATVYVDDVTFDVASAPAPTPEAATAATSSASTQSDRPAAAGTARRRGASSITGVATSERQRGDIVINEVMYDPQSQPDGDGEWIELYNRGDSAIDVGGWSIEDARSVDVLPSLVVPAREYAIVAASDAFRGSYPAYAGAIAFAGRLGNGLGNEGDRVALVGADGILVDAVSWGTDGSAFDPAIADVPEGHSFERRVAGTDTGTAIDFVDNEQPSPGEPFAPPAARRVNRSGGVEILEARADGALAWIPWALAAIAGAVLVGMLGWRLIETARPRRPEA